MNTLDFYKFAKSTSKATPSQIGDYINKFNNLNVPRNFITPYIIEQSNLNLTQLDVFSRLMVDRVLFLGDEIDDTVSNIIVSQLLFLSSEDDSKDISIYINSPGGSVYSGLAILDAMNYIPNNIQTICCGCAASMAAVLLCAGNKGDRYALPHSRVMIHQPLGGASGQASDIEITCKEILKLKEELYEIISTNSGQPIQKIYEDADRDYWMTAKEAKEYGLIDELLINKKK